jgi:hypothetical protein
MPATKTTLSTKTVSFESYNERHLRSAFPVRRGWIPLSPGKEPAALIRNLLESQMDFWEICPILVLGKLAGFFDELSKARRPSRELTARRGHVRNRRYMRRTETPWEQGLEVWRGTFEALKFVRGPQSCLKCFTQCLQFRSASQSSVASPSSKARSLALSLSHFPFNISAILVFLYLFVVTSPRHALPTLQTWVRYS